MRRFCFFVRQTESHEAEWNGAKRRRAIVWNKHEQAGKQAGRRASRQAGRQASSSRSMPGKLRNMAVDSPLYASCPLYKRERAVIPCRAVPSRRTAPLSLGRLKFNSGTAAARLPDRLLVLLASLAHSLLLSPPAVIERSIYTAWRAQQDFRLDDFVRERRRRLLCGKNCGATRGPEQK